MTGGRRRRQGVAIPLPCEIKTVDLNGVPATLVTPVNGYGDYRIALGAWWRRLRPSDPAPSRSTPMGR